MFNGLNIDLDFHNGRKFYTVFSMAEAQDKIIVSLHSEVVETGLLEEVRDALTTCSITVAHQQFIHNNRRCHNIQCEN